MKSILGVAVVWLAGMQVVLPERTRVDDWPGFLEEVRTHVLGYVDRLPSFICRETVQRYASFGRDTREVLDTVVSELSFYEQAEHRKILSVGNRRADEDATLRVKGPTSKGEFAGSLRSLFDPATKATFELDGYEKVRGHQTVRVKYSVPLETSRSMISLGSRTITTAYRGRCWIDLESRSVVRIEDSALDLPADFPVTASSSRTDYDLVEIAGQRYWLPVSATMIMVARSSRRAGEYDFYHELLGEMGLPNLYPPEVEARNVIRYDDYQKFGAEVKVTF